MKTINNILLLSIFVVFTSCNNDRAASASLSELQKDMIVKKLRTYGELSKFTTAFDAKDFSHFNVEKFTVFAATNDAFNQLSLLSGDESNECNSFYIERYIVEGKYVLSASTDSLILNATDGTPLLITRIGERIFINGVELVDVISVGENTVYFIEHTIPCTAPAAPEKPDVPVTGITVSRSALSLEVGESRVVFLRVEPDNAKNKNVTWQCDKDGVVKVNPVAADSFSITAIAEGTAKITFMTDEGGYTATCIATVSKENGADDENKPGNTDAVVIETKDYIFQTSCGLATSKLHGDSVYIVNSKEALLQYITCEKEADSDIDFDKYSLLLVHGTATSDIGGITKTLLQISPVEFTLKVEIKSGMAAVAQKWTVAVLTPKISQDANVGFTKIINY